jgi:hypothetical protein
MAEWLEFFNAYRAPAHHIASLAIALAVWRWGGSPERYLSAVFIGTMVAPIYVIRLLNDKPLAFFYEIYVAIDIVAAVLFTIIAVNAYRTYPMWVAGFQLVAVGAHMVGALVETVSPLAIVVLVIGPSYCQLLVLFVGFVRHVRRGQNFGSYRNWRIPSPQMRVIQH